MRSLAPLLLALALPACGWSPIVDTAEAPPFLWSCSCMRDAVDPAGGVATDEWFGDVCGLEDACADACQVGGAVCSCEARLLGVCGG